MLEAQSQQQQLQALTASGATAQAIKDFNTKLSQLLKEQETSAAQEPETTKAEGHVVLAEMQEQIGTLYGIVMGGARAPTAAEVAAADAAGQDVEKLEQQWQQLQAGLPALNQALRKAGLAPVRTGMAPARDLNVADLDEE